MEIKTKFNVGDKVWSFQSSLFNGVVPYEFKIEEIKTRSFLNGIKQIYTEFYYLGEKHRIGLLEHYCFATKEEAQKECDRRNGKEL